MGRFAGYQPFTPVFNTVRALPLGGPAGHDAILAGAWSTAIIAACYPLARRRYDRDPR
jgi:ABC-2 type transport system permease protein